MKQTTKFPFMEEWKQYKLGELLTLKYGKDHKSLKKGNIPVYGSGGVIRYANNSLSIGPSILIPRKGSLNNIIFVDKYFWTVDTMFWSIINNIKVNPQYLYYYLKQIDFSSMNVGSAVPSLTVPIIENIDVTLPDLHTQNKIARILSSLEYKVELNKRINDNLEQQAQALFNYYFIDTPELLGGFSIGSLVDAANYVNGLAMQKYRPINGEKGLPVLKIKELGQGKIDSSSDFCSNEIDSYYKVYDGDVIFSWSGTLMVKIWCGGECGLNQHLFKVSSKTTPKWFYYFWTKHHLDNFIRIAKDKAVTMGHIKREELGKAKILFPNTFVMKKLDTLIAPYIEQIIEKECEIKKLTLLRDALLPKLMSGELKITDINN